MSLISNDKTTWATCTICLVTMSQNNKDEVYPEKIGEMILQNNAFISRR